MLSMDTGRSEMDRGKLKTASPRVIQDKHYLNRHKEQCDIQCEL